MTVAAPKERPEPTIATVLAGATARLRAASFGPAPREARLLLARALGYSEAQILAHPERAVDLDSLGRFEEWLARRLRGEPVAYLLGEREFFARRFVVDPRVLIPRPETEHLVERCLELDLRPGARVLDVGTGSGSIAVTLAVERPSWTLFASDLSVGAVAVAAENRRLHGVESRVRLFASDLISALRIERLDLIVCNPPYIDRAASETLSVEVRSYEPPLALFARRRGLDFHGRLLEALACHPAGPRLLVEIGFDQSEAVTERAEALGLQICWMGRDLAGHPRVLEIAPTRSSSAAADTLEPNLQ